LHLNRRVIERICNLPHGTLASKEPDEFRPTLKLN